MCLPRLCAAQRHHFLNLCSVSSRSFCASNCFRIQVASRIVTWCSSPFLRPSTSSAPKHYGHQRVSGGIRPDQYPRWSGSALADTRAPHPPRDALFSAPMRRKPFEWRPKPRRRTSRPHKDARPTPTTCPPPSARERALCGGRSPRQSNHLNSAGELESVNRGMISRQCATASRQHPFAEPAPESQGELAVLSSLGLVALGVAKLRVRRLSSAVGQHRDCSRDVGVFRSASLRRCGGESLLRVRQRALSRRLALRPRPQPSRQPSRS